MVHMLDMKECSLGMKECSLGMKECSLGRKVCSLGMMEYNLGKMMDSSQLDFSWLYSLDMKECSLGKMVYNLGKLVVSSLGKMGSLEYKLDNSLDISLAQSTLRLDRRLVLQHHRGKYRSSTQHPKIQFYSSFHNHSLVLQDSSHTMA